MQEDNIDLRVYVDILLRRRRVIILVTALLVLGAGIYSLLSPPVYRSATGLVVAPKRADLTLTAALNLTAEDAQRVDLRYRNAALVEIARSLEIARQVVESDPALLDELGLKSATDLTHRVEVSGKDDWISIEASASDAQLAARLAAAWAQAAANRINVLYAPDATVATNLQRESQTAEAEYRSRQAALEDFLRTSRRAEVESQIQRLEAALNWASLDMPTVNTYRQQALLRQLLLDAEALRRKLQQNAGSPAEGWGAAMSFITLQTQAFGGQLAGQSYQLSADGKTLDLTLQGVSPGVWYLDLSVEPPTVTLADVENLIGILEAKLSTVQAELDTPLAENSAVQARMSQISAMTEELTALQLQLEQERAQLWQLTSARDAARQAYLALVNKSYEVQVESAVSITEVQVAFAPLPPSTPSAPSTMINTAIGAMAGLLIGVIFALGQAYLGQEVEIKARTRLGHWLLNASGLPNYQRRSVS